MHLIFTYIRVGYVRACQIGSVHSKCCSTQTVIIYMCGVSQTPSLHIVVGWIYINFQLEMQHLIRFLR